jgi:hypothetical protein
MMDNAIAKINELMSLELGSLAEEKKPRERVGIPPFLFVKER